MPRWPALERRPVYSSNFGPWNNMPRSQALVPLGDDKIGPGGQRPPCPPRIIDSYNLAPAADPPYEPGTTLIVYLVSSTGTWVRSLGTGHGARYWSRSRGTITGHGHWLRSRGTITGCGHGARSPSTRHGTGRGAGYGHEARSLATVTGHDHWSR
ncbi:hypothetical protein CRG98_006548 [Punica granatum]|uniref:Uncharacterized protein n=1 Tax=Punica granatum TaxID=22663 RepID=A0A2I0KXG8_PUNGR|nr:hypothetical protein CRG98_006548 [Punica granatum]